jgi:hypothetical protein
LKLLISIVAAFAQRVAVKVIPLRFRKRLQLFPRGPKHARDGPRQHYETSPEPEIALNRIKLALHSVSASIASDVTNLLSTLPAKSKFVISPIAPALLRNESLVSDRSDVFTV